MSEGRSLTRVRVRLLLTGLLTSLAVGAVCARLVYLTVVERAELEERGELQHQQTLKLDAKRGAILDRNGRELAVSVEVESIYAVPKTFSPEEVETAASELASCLGIPRKRIEARLEGKKSFAWLERKAKPETVRCVRSLNLAGIGFLDESRRFYPKRTLLSQVLGYVGIDNAGMGGVEYALEEQIRGESGSRIIWTDALRRRAGSRIETRSVSGRSVYLTIDENLQYITETELASVIRESRAKSGIAIVMRPHTGELLAIASFPRFNPNRYGDSPEGHRRNRAVTDAYEPGSTFKVFVAAAALQEGVATEDERIDCGRGTIVVGDRVIHDHAVFDVLTFREVLEKSSNVGMIRIGQRLGRDRMESYLRAFGFGEPTGVELPGESRGIVRPAERWGPVTAASVSFGQEIGVTPLQMVTAANVVATSGYLMRPRLLLGYGGADGRLGETFSPEPVRRVIDEKTAARLKDLLIGVVQRGTGRKAAIEGYRVAGKTGTAQKAALGGYSRSDYVASFVGFAPADRPELTAIVILDSPEGDHSGSRAAGVFSRIMERSLLHLGVPRDDEPVVRIAKVWPQIGPILEAEGPAKAEVRNLAVESRVPEPAPGAPDVRGLAARDALARFVASGLVPELEGAGFVLEQQPQPGELLEEGSRARLVLGPKALFGGERRREEAPPTPPRAVRVAGMVLGREP